MKLLKTSKENKHGHIVYLKEDGTGRTSISKDHSHPVMAGIIAPADDGHTHEIEEYPVKEKKDKEDDETIAKDVVKFYKEAKEYEKESRKKGEESDRFAKGNQWEKDEKEILNKKQRAALTINEIEPIIDLLSGYQRQNRTDFRFLPVEEGDARVSDILNILVKNVTEQCSYDHEETKIFEDSAIVGRGIMNVHIDYDKDMRGDIIIEKFPWTDVYFGPHEKMDLSDCEFLVKTKWFSKAKVKQMWPDKADKIQKELDAYKEDKSPHIVTHGEQYVHSENTLNWTNPDPDLIDMARKEYRVMECWRKVYERNRVLINVDDDFYFNAKGWKDSDVEAVKTIPGFRIIDRVVTKMRVTKVASKTLLEDEYPELAVDDFHILPVYAKKRGKDWWGKVEPAKDPQREINKRHSQAVDIMNKVAAYGWFYDTQTFASPGDEEKFRNQSASPGFMAKVSDINRPPAKVEGVKFPGEIVNLETLATQKLREIMNVNPEVQGVSPRESGVALVERKKSALIGNEFLFDNLDMAKRKLGRIIVAMIQKLYTPERIMRILKSQNKREPVQLANQPLEAHDEQVILELLKNTDLTKHDVVVSESPFSPTMRQANFAVWMQLAQTRPEVPIEFLIDLSDLPDKDKFKSLMAQTRQAAAAQEDKKYQTELAKTAMAKGMMGPGMGGGMAQ